MKEIELTKGYRTLVDDEDFDWLSEWTWGIAVNPGFARPYAARRVQKDKKQGIVLMHRLLLSPPPGIFSDHINRNTLDNRRSNLRLATPRQNAANQSIRSDNTSGFKGVVFKRDGGRPWAAQLGADGRKYHLGRFHTPEEAARAYDAAALVHFGEFAAVNFPEEH